MNPLVRLVRRSRLQPLWQWLHRMSLVAMNFWSSEFNVTGERDALTHVARRLVDVPKPVIFDVGANVGAFSVACMEEFGGRCRLHAFEPATSTFERLRLVPELSDHSTVRLHRCALSDHVGSAVLHSSEAGSSIASLEELDRPLRPFRGELDEEVPLTTLDEICQAEGVERIDFLKLDIEGHELAALRGAKRMLDEGRISFLQFEFGENNVSSRTYLADFDKILADRFNIYRIVPGGLIPWKYEGSRSEVFATMNYLCEFKRTAN